TLPFARSFTTSSRCSRIAADLSSCCGGCAWATGAESDDTIEPASHASHASHLFARTGTDGHLFPAVDRGLQDAVRMKFRRRGPGHSAIGKNIAEESLG